MSNTVIAKYRNQKCKICPLTLLIFLLCLRKIYPNKNSKQKVVKSSSFQDFVVKCTVPNNVVTLYDVKKTIVTFYRKTSSKLVFSFKLNQE